MCDIWLQEKNLKKAAKILGEKKVHLHARESTTKSKVLFHVNDTKKVKEKFYGHIFYGFLFCLYRSCVRVFDDDRNDY